MTTRKDESVYEPADMPLSGAPIRNPKKYEHRYTVRGAGSLPYDMLRYDASFPATGGDASVAEAQQGRHSAKQSITLLHYGADRFWSPAVERWRSFGWQVITTL